MGWTTRDQEIYNRLQKEGKLEHKDFPAVVVNIDSALGQVEAIVSVMGVRDMVQSNPRSDSTARDCFREGQRQLGNMSLCCATSAVT